MYLKGTECPGELNTGNRWGQHILTSHNVLQQKMIAIKILIAFSGWLPLVTFLYSVNATRFVLTALRQLWPSSVGVEQAGCLGNSANNHMSTQITLTLWSSGLISFVLGTLGQTITEGIWAEARYHTSSAGKEDCQKLSAEDAEQFWGCLEEDNTSHRLG